jgi:2-methylcitrate dehydratase PrpD
MSIRELRPQTQVSQTRNLADYASAFQLEDLPAPVTRQLKLHLLDAIGAAVYGAEQPWTQTIRNLVTGWGGAGQSTVWNTDIRLPVPNAAFVNSVATHAFELDDRRIASYMHPASATLPAALAVADGQGGRTGRDVLAAIAAGYEVGLRVGMAIGKGAFERGFYPPGLGGAIAAAVTASRLLNLDPPTIGYALNLAATQASGLYSPTMIKRFNLGRGTYNGVLAAQLAEAGFTGVDDVLEADFGGFCKAFANEPNLDLLDAGLGQTFEIANTELKPYVSSRPNHTSIDCMLQLRNENPEVNAQSVAEIEIEVGTPNFRYGAGFEVDSVPAALMSVAYCVVVALVDGQAFLDQFTEDRVADPELQDLLRRTSVAINTDFDGLGLEKRDMTTVRCRLKNGQLYEASRAFAKGHPSYPLSEDEVVAKFETLVGDRLEHEHRRQIQDLVLDLESVDSVGQLTRLLAR